MGHYQQWLHYREVEQQLQTQLETLKQELLQLQARAQCLEQQGSEAFPNESANPILYALAAHFSEHYFIIRSCTPNTTSTNTSTRDNILSPFWMEQLTELRATGNAPRGSYQRYTTGASFLELAAISYSSF